MQVKYLNNDTILRSNAVFLLLLVPFLLLELYVGQPNGGLWPFELYLRPTKVVIEGNLMI